MGELSEDLSLLCRVDVSGPAQTPPQLEGDFPILNHYRFTISCENEQREGISNLHTRASRRI